MGQDNSKTQKYGKDSLYLNKILKTDVNDVEFNSDDKLIKKRYDFIVLLKNKIYSNDNNFINKLNIDYFLIVKYLIRISITLDYLNGYTQPIFYKSQEFQDLVEYRENFEFYKKKLDSFIKNTNKEIDEYISKLEKNTGDSNVIRKYDNQIKKEIYNITTKNKSILKNNISDYTKKYSIKINNKKSKLSPVELKILSIPIDLYSNISN